MHIRQPSYQKSLWSSRSNLLSSYKKSFQTEPFSTCCKETTTSFIFSAYLHRKPFYTPMEQSTLTRRGLGLGSVDHSAVSPGYALFAHLTFPGIVRLISTNGLEVHRWKLPYRPGRHARILPNGNLAYNGVHPDGPNLFPMFAKYRDGMVRVDELTYEGASTSPAHDGTMHHMRSQLSSPLAFR